MSLVPSATAEKHDPIRDDRGDAEYEIDRASGRYAARASYGRRVGGLGRRAVSGY